MLRRTAIILVCVFFLPACFCFRSVDFSGKNQIALVEIKGVIIEPGDVVDDLEEANRDESIKGILIRVDSPGGSVGASEEIYRTIIEINKAKPVVVSMGDIAASGGYLVSAPARKIFANETTVTGSIGVRLELMDAQDLYAFIKLKPETIKAGKYKDMGSTTRPLTTEEREILNNFVGELHALFKGYVSTSRNISIEEVDKIADGTIFTGLKAKELGLVDEIGGFIDAKRALAQMAGIKGAPRVKKIRKNKPWWYELVAEQVSQVLGLLNVKTSPRVFLYQWKI